MATDQVMHVRCTLRRGGKQVLRALVLWTKWTGKMPPDWFSNTVVRLVTRTRVEENTKEGTSR